MYSWRILPCCIISLTLTLGLFAQNSDPVNASVERQFLGDLKQIKVFSTNHQGDFWTLFEDERQSSFYIDFDHFDLNLKEIIVRNSAGVAVYHRVVYQLPVDHIFELDFSNYDRGFYTIEVHSFISSFSKSLYFEPATR